MKERYDGSMRERTFDPEVKVYTVLDLKKEWTAATVKDVNGRITIAHQRNDGMY